MSRSLGGCRRPGKAQAGVKGLIGQATRAAMGLIDKANVHITVTLFSMKCPSLLWLFPLCMLGLLTLAVLIQVGILILLQRRETPAFGSR